MSPTAGSPLPGGRYRLLRELGRGGLGIVYEAHDHLNRQRIALKRLNIISDNGETDDSRVLLSLANEFRTGASLRHPYIAPVLDYGFDIERKPFFTMELIPDAKPLMPYAKGLDMAARIRLIIQTLQALAYLHRCGIIHRDLKPANILVSADDTALLVDFGVALQTFQKSHKSDTDIVGTLAYMSPELLRGELASVASDLWSVGIIMNEVFSGVHPFDPQNTDSGGRLMRKILHQPPDLSRLSADIMPVVGRLLLPDPTDRYPDASAVIAALCEATGQPLPNETTAERESYLSAAPFVGRDQELAALTEALNPKQPNTPRAYLIGGESGIGKSRLIDELRVRALVDGYTVVRGQGSESGAQPYQLWREPLRRLILGFAPDDSIASILKPIIPDLDLLLEREIQPAPLLEGLANERRLNEAILKIFAQQTQPVLLLLEDLHWAEDNLTPLKLLLAYQHELPLVIVATFRTDERASLPDMLPEMTQMRLERLPPEAVKYLVTAMVGLTEDTPALAERLGEATDGNAFFLIEVMRELAEQAGTLHNISMQTLPLQLVAGGMKSVVERRLARVPEVYHRALKLAAVVGRRIDIGLMNALIDDVDGFITACANAVVFAYADGDWRFAHDKLREGVLNWLTDDEKIAYNCQIAVTIEMIYPDDRSRSPALFEHYTAGGDARKACHHAVVAAEVLSEASSLNRAESVLERGLELCKDLADLSLEALIVANLGNVGFLRGHFDAAQAHYSRSLELADSLNEHPAILRALHGLGRSAVRRRDLDSAESFAMRALELARSLDDQRGTAISCNTLGNIAFLRGNYDLAHEFHSQTLKLAETLNDLAFLGTAYTQLGLIHLYRGNLDEARERFLNALDAHERSGNLQETAGALHNLGIVHYHQNDDQGARAMLERSLILRERVGYEAGIAETAGNLGVIAAKQGDHAAARQAYERAKTINLKVGNLFGVVNVMNNLGHLLIKESDALAAKLHFQDALRHAKGGQARFGVIEALAGFSEAALEQEDAVRAAELAGLADANVDPNPADLLRQEYLTPLFEKLRAALPGAQLQAALERGRSLDLEETVEALIAD